jgi:hypothetical protein
VPVVTHLKRLAPSLIVAGSILVSGGLVFIGLLKVANSVPYSIQVEGRVDADVSGSVDTY